MSSKGDRKQWNKRRSWLDRVAVEQRLTTGCRTWLLAISRRSDDTCKKVWGRQTGQALEIGKSDRSVRRYSVEAEQLGYISVYRSTPERNPETGRWKRRQTNVIYFRLPAKEKAVLGAPRRRLRAPYCVVSRKGRRPSHLPANDGRSTRLGCSTGAAPPTNNFRDAPKTEDQWCGEMSPLVLDAIASAKAALRAAAAAAMSPPASVRAGM